MNVAHSHTTQELELVEQWWVNKSRSNFFAFRRYMRGPDFKYNWFVMQLSFALQQFYLDLLKGKRPILLIAVPPQHGKSWSIEDIVSWIAGKDPDLRMVFSSFSDYLGVRCNSYLQRTLLSEKYHKVFPETNINPKNVVTLATHYRRNSSMVEFINNKGSFRNTTVGGPITGESLDVGFIDDPIKGRKEANSKVVREGVWNWLTDDFLTRFSDMAGFIITMTRWHVDDPVGRLLKKLHNSKSVKVIRFPALAEKDEPYRKIDDPLFPELKSKEFLLNKKAMMLDSAWWSLYQGKPTVEGGNMIKDTWWCWWEVLPKMVYTFAVADTAQKKNNWNDYTVFQHWGKGVDGNIYLLDMIRERVLAPDLRRKAEIFYRKCNALRIGGTFRGMCIEDKSSGIGLIQEMEEKNLKVHAIPREADKVTRCHDSGPYIKAGNVYLNTAVPYVGYITQEGKEFPDGEYDDAFDCTMNGIEVAYIHNDILNAQTFIS